MEKNFVSAKALESAEPSRMQPVLDSTPDIPKKLETVHMQREPCTQPQNVRDVPSEGAADTIKQLNNLVSHCMEMDVSGDKARNWLEDAKALLEALKWLGEWKHG